MDTGCKVEFGGSGICINVKESMENFGIDWEAGHDPKPNLCEHTLNKDCCSCFKLNDKKECRNDICKEKGGKCVMPYMNDMLTMLVEEGWNWEYYCDEQLNCKCYLPEGIGNNRCENVIFQRWVVATQGVSGKRRGMEGTGYRVGKLSKTFF